ncbi:MAG: hypothetical protein BWY74_00919 [Firmicutes bacterium ADurb.Bin419]|nr:MAG: hypothetical protein BWY74_00919 [Firmicutes bacterium ADurb.Bin419]
MIQKQVGDANCIFHFIQAFKSVFVMIRAYPEAEYNTVLLKVFQKYIEQAEQLNNIGIARLKNDINDIEGIEELKVDLISTLDVYSYKEDIKDLERLSKYLPVLNELVYELLVQLQSKDFTRVRDLADASHNFPEFMIKDTWSPKEYWGIYITPYRKHWDKNFLNNLKKYF